MYRSASFLLSLVAGLCLSCHAPDKAEEDEVDPPSAIDRQDLDDQWRPVGTGPWGTLEYRRFFLPVPKAWRERRIASGSTVWHVPKLTPAKVNELIVTGPLTAAEKKTWQETCRVETVDDGSIIYPSKDFRWALRPESRALIYRWLAKFPRNEALALPSCYPVDSQGDWFQNCNLRPELTEAIKHFLYPSGQLMCFADLDLLEEYVEEPEERAELLAVLHRQPYCELRLRIDRGTDLNSLSTYWGEGNRVVRVKKLLQQELGKQQSAYVSLAKVLPSLPRSLLNTYPAANQDSGQPPPNCSWTALNFFNRKADNRFTDWELFKETLARQHDPVKDRPRYGDLVVLQDGNGHAEHVAVYLADDFVFTKNGGHLTKPWVVMKMADMKASYPPAPPIYYRWNPLKDKPAAHLTSVAPQKK